MSSGNRAVLWDVGGTLVEFACSLPAAVRARLDQCGLGHLELLDSHIEQTYSEFIREEQRWRTLEQEHAAERAWLTSLLNGQPKSVVDRGMLMPRYFNLYQPVPGIIGLLTDLQSAGIRLAIVSNWAPFLPEFLDHHQLTRYFDAIIYSSQTGIHKPDHRIFQSALDAIKCTADRTIFIGDNPELDIAPSRAMGMYSIHFDPCWRHKTSDAGDVVKLRKLLAPLLSLSIGQAEAPTPATPPKLI